MTTRDVETRQRVMETITTFYSMYQKNGIPPSAMELATKMGRNKWNVTRHLQKGVAMGMLSYRMVPGGEFGVRGFRMWHPITTNKESKP